MPTQKISTTLGSRSVAIHQAGALNQIQRWFAAALEKGERWVRSPLLRIRPRVSLFSGSVLVLLTLFLPTTIDSCGRAKPGYKLALGEKDTYWPSLFFLASERASRAFYMVSLTLAVLTLLLLLVSLYRVTPLRNDGGRGLPNVFFVAVGTVSLFVWADYSSWAIEFLPYAMSDVTGAGDLFAILATSYLLLLVPISFLRPEFWKLNGFLAWLVGAGGVVFSLFLIDLLRHGGRLQEVTTFVLKDVNTQSEDVSLPGLICLLLYCFLPLLVWYRVGLRRGTEAVAKWTEIRPRLQRLWAFQAVSAGVVVVVVAVIPPDLWGLPCYFIGINLIALGYMRLAREAALVTAPANLGVVQEPT